MYIHKPTREKEAKEPKIIISMDILCVQNRDYTANVSRFIVPVPSLKSQKKGEEKTIEIYRERKNKREKRKNKREERKKQKNRKGEIERRKRKERKKNI